VEPNDSIAAVKDNTFNKDCMPDQHQRLASAEKQLLDNRSLRDNSAKR
jgi:hypothetical protein